MTIMLKASQNIRRLVIIGGYIVTFTCLIKVQSANALTFVDNLSESNDVNSGGFSWRATSFSTNNQNYTLDSVSLRLFETAESANFFVNIYDDNSGTPGSIVTNGSLSIPEMSNVFDDYIFSATNTLKLNANNTYWIVSGLSVDDGGSYAYRRTRSDNQASLNNWTIGDIEKISSNQGSSWSDSFFISDSPVTMISVDATASIPFEFSPCLGLLFSCLGFGYSYYLSRKKKFLNLRYFNS